jgi:hypothetical protein
MREQLLYFLSVSFAFTDFLVSRGDPNVSVSTHSAFLVSKSSGFHVIKFYLHSAGPVVAIGNQFPTPLSPHFSGDRQ